MSKPYAKRIDAKLAELPDGRIVTHAEASCAGYSLATPPASAVATPTVAQAQAEVRYAAAKQYEADINALPESDDRPFAAAHLAANYTAETMPLDRAAGFLRGLPPEPAPVTKADTATAAARELRLQQLGRAGRAVRGN